jgi:hypothetical protein
VAQAHLLQPGGGLGQGRRLVLAPDQQGHGHVFLGGEFGQQVVELVDEAQGAIAQAAPRDFGQRPEGFARPP